jgi:hypothetical protein
MLECGKHCVTALAKRCEAGHKREASTEHISGLLAGATGDKVRVDLVIRAYHAWRVFVLDSKRQKLADHVPFSTLSQGYTLLLTSVKLGTPEESYVALPGREDDCHRLFAEGVAANWSVVSAKDQCQALVTLWEQENQARAKREQEAAEKSKQEAAAALASNKAELTEAQKREQELAEQLKKEQDEKSRESLLQNMQHEKDRIAEIQRKQIADQSRHDEEKRKEAAAKREAERAGKRAESIQRKRDGKGKGQRSDKEHGRATPQEDVLAVFKKAKLEDAAEMLLKMVGEREDRIDLLQELLLAVSGDKRFGKEVCEAAYSAADGIETARAADEKAAQEAAAA